MPLKSFVVNSRFGHISTQYVVEKSLFYDLCARANSVCNINYDTITLIDLLGFVALQCKDSFVNMSINRLLESEKKKNEMFNKMTRGR